MAGHTAAVTAVAVAPEGRLVASAALDHTVRVWDLRDSTPLRVLSGHAHLIGSLAFSEDSVLLTSADASGVLLVWGMRDVVRPPPGADGEAWRTVGVPGDAVATSSAFLACRMGTKASRVVSAQFSARNLLLVATEFRDP